MAILSTVHATVIQPDGATALATRSDIDSASRAVSPDATATGSSPAAPGLRSRGNAALAGLQERIAQCVPSRDRVQQCVGYAIAVGGTGVIMHGFKTFAVAAKENALSSETSMAPLLGIVEGLAGSLIAIAGGPIAGEAEERMAYLNRIRNSPMRSIPLMSSASSGRAPLPPAIEMLEITHQVPAPPLPGDEMV